VQFRHHHVSIDLKKGRALLLAASMLLGFALSVSQNKPEQQKGELVTDMFMFKFRGLHAHCQTQSTDESCRKYVAAAFFVAHRSTPFQELGWRECVINLFLFLRHHSANSSHDIIDARLWCGRFGMACHAVRSQTVHLL